MGFCFKDKQQLLISWPIFYYNLQYLKKLIAGDHLQLSLEKWNSTSKAQLELQER